MDRDVGTGLVRSLASGGVATVGLFRHGAGPHRDPDEEAFGADTVIVPLAGVWTYHGRAAPAEIAPGVVVAGRAGSRFGARHRSERPDDRTFYVELSSTSGAAEGAFERDVVPRTTSVAHAIADLWREASTDDLAKGLAVDILALRLTIELARVSPIGRVPPVARDAVDAAREYLEAHYAERIDLATLARVAHLSPFHLARAFRARVGTSPHRHLMDVRLAAAEALLRDGDLTVTRVADRTGFVSLGHFARRFGARYGMSPSAYRRTFGRGSRTKG